MNRGTHCSTQYIAKKSRSARAWFAALGVLALFPLPLSALSPALPDLKIAQVNEGNMTGKPQVVNSGRATSGMCRIFAYRWTGTGWTMIAWQTIPSLAPGAKFWACLTANGIQLSPTMYVVDATNVVVESNELNNRYVHF